MKKYIIILFFGCHIYADRGSSMIVAQANLPTFGKTHFIIGQPTVIVAEKKQEKKEATLEANNGSIVGAYFSPDDDLSEQLQRLIAQERKAIRIAIFMFTDTTIANALIAAKNRGVSVEIISDAGCLKERSSKIGHVCDNGCVVYIYNPGYQSQEAGSLMHHKFALFEDNDGKPAVWTGSYNFTKGARNSNQENAVILRDGQTFNKFDKQFDMLKNRSFRYGNSSEVK